MTESSLIIWGARGHAKVLHEFAAKVGYRVIAIFDQDNSLQSPLLGVPLFGGEDGFVRWRALNDSEDVYGQVAIGGSRGRDRIAVQDCLEGAGIRFTAMVHPAAYVATDATIGAGSQVLINATVCTSATLGRGCIINTGASVDHECMLGKGVHIGPGATLAGCVKVGDYSFVGPGAVVISGTVIGANSIIGAGAVVTRDVPDNTVVYGVPAKFVRDNP